jgi:hypothetical protein
MTGTAIVLIQQSLCIRRVCCRTRRLQPIRSASSHGGTRHNDIRAHPRRFLLEVTLCAQLPFPVRIGMLAVRYSPALTNVRTPTFLTIPLRNVPNYGNARAAPRFNNPCMMHFCASLKAGRSSSDKPPHNAKVLGSASSTRSARTKWYCRASN